MVFDIALGIIIAWGVLCGAPIVFMACIMGIIKIMSNKDV